MITEDAFSSKPAARRLSRRRFVSLAATFGTGVAALPLAGCGDHRAPDSGPSPTTAVPADSGTAGLPTVRAGPTAKPQKGGVARFPATGAGWDTLDADRSRSSLVAALLGYTNLGILHYRTWAAAEIEGGFAERWEQPDVQTLILKLRPNLVWHDKPPVNGRPAKVEDMRFFIERNRSGKVDGRDDPAFSRKGDFGAVESVDATDSSTLRVRLSRPDPLLLTALAGSFSKVQAPEAVQQFEKSSGTLDPAYVIGTGAYALEHLTAEGAFRLRRFERFALGVPLLDALEAAARLGDSAAQQAAFEQKRVDLFSPRLPGVANELLRRYEGQMYNVPVYATSPLAGTYYGGAPPWSNRNLIGGIFRAMDRRRLVQHVFQGSGALSGNVPPPQGPFGLTERELVTFPGYLEDRVQDLAEARKLWDAGGGASLGPVLIDIPDILEGGHPGVGALIQKTLKDGLGGEWTVRYETYGTINSKIARQEYGNGRNNIWYGWIGDVQRLEPTLDLWQAYNSRAPQFSQFGVRIDRVDELSNRATVELDVTRRREACREIERLLLENWGAGIAYNAVQVMSTLRWNYLKAGEATAFPNTHNTWRDVWLDPGDPSHTGRAG